MNVVSLFDGMSCGQLTLKNLGIKVDNYFASEIDKYAIQITQHNFPNTIQLGDVSKITAASFPNIQFPIDLLIGGSPCKDLSFANKGKLGLEGEKSKLFYEFVRLKNELKPKYFFLENVVPTGNWKSVMDEHMGCVGVTINSSLFVPQSRKRIYWTNIPFEMPTQQEYTFKFEENPDPKYNASKNILDNEERMKYILSRKSEVCGCLTEAIARNGSSKEYMSWLGWMNNQTGVVRKPTPVEAERLQGVPDNYTAVVSDSQRYKVLGNGWNVNTIEHMFSPLKNIF